MLLVYVGVDVRVYVPVIAGQYSTDSTFFLSIRRLELRMRIGGGGKGASFIRNEKLIIWMCIHIYGRVDLQ